MLHLKTRPETFVNDRFFPQSFNSVINALMDERKTISTANDFIPTADILETDAAFEIRLALAGLSKEDIKISLEGDLLQVEGEKKAVEEPQKFKFLKREMNYGRFSRSFKVGKIEASKIEAEFNQGILSITLPKRAEEKPSQIAIK